MHTFASAATGLVAIGYLVNLVNASPVAIGHRDITLVSNQVLENPTPTFEAAAKETSHRCCTTSCDFCHPSDTCVGNCGMHFFFIRCCSSEMTKNAVLVHNIDEIDWKEYLAKEAPTAISSPKAEIEHYKSLAAADHAKFDHIKSVASKRDSAEVDDADGPKHCCTFGCGFCTPQRCVKEKDTMECNRGTFAECCDHKHTKNSIFVESADDIPWELLGDDWLGEAYATPRTLTERAVSPTMVWVPDDKDVAPEVEAPKSLHRSPEINPRDGGDDTDDKTASQWPFGNCCQDGCTFCSADHSCFVLGEEGCPPSDKPQYNTCCVPNDDVIWVPGDEDGPKSLESS